jgi:hypothetical protein
MVADVGNLIMVWHLCQHDTEACGKTHLYLLVCFLAFVFEFHTRSLFFNFTLSLLNINYLPPIKVIFSFHHYICLCVFVCSCFFVLPQQASASQPCFRTYTPR